MIEKILPVHEFGKAIHISYAATGEVSAFAQEIMNREVDLLKEELSWIKDVVFIGEPEFVEANVDPINRFRAVGWRVKAASEGYDVLKRHFHCRHAHIPDVITKDFLMRVIEQYARQMNEDEDYEQ